MDRFKLFAQDAAKICGPVPLHDYNYSINISLKNRYIYVETPKAACSTIKLSLISFELEYDFSHHEYNSNYIHLRDWTPLLTPKQVVSFQRLLALPFIKFCFVRNPFTRILSAYLDKICRKKLEKKAWESLFCNRSLSDTISFDDFLNAVAQQPIRAMDTHWRPQYFQTFQQHIHYDLIGRFESLAADFERLSKMLAHNGNLTMRQEVSHKTNAAALLEEFYTDHAIQLVREIYEADFRHFHYSTDIADARN